MFPDQIADVALVTIKHHEWNTFDYLIGILREWMVSPDRMTAKAAAKIANALYEECKEKSHLFRYLYVARDLFKYAAEVFCEENKSNKK